jgi:hypothetical protein
MTAAAESVIAHSAPQKSLAGIGAIADRGKDIGGDRRRDRLDSPITESHMAHPGMPTPKRKKSHADYVIVRPIGKRHTDSADAA